MSRKIPVSVVIMTKNEENNIRKCIHSVQDFSEIYVVDSNSTDQTLEIAHSLGAKVVNFTWDGKYPKKKQWALEQLPFQNDYVFYVDADEEVTPKLNAEIRNIFEAKDTAAGYFVGYDYVFMDKVLKHGHQVYKLVIFDRKRGKFLDYDDLDANNMWEVEGHYQPQIDGKVAIFKEKMVHNDHDSIFDYFARHNRYSDWEAHVRLNGALSNPQESQPLHRVIQKKLFNAMPFKWVIAFFHSFVLKFGFLDGSSGFHFAVARAMYYWQVEVKMRELKSKSSKTNQIGKQVKV
ncbi:glycosyltransferase involved in cell wall biosynthesis [Paenibacillus sp. DS2015]|uniref:glycosyltransferase family 2 protein n=1 Tax=Paenibacillus sp. DS2015 TaxID=3373917 RepID=UPI003D1DD7C7